MSPSFLRIALVLGLLSAIGPFAIDMYLPALPAIGAGLGTTPDAVQASLTAFFAAMAVSQLVYGPAADMLGRRPPLVAGLLIFAVGSVGCAVAPDIGWLVACRFIQGLGAGAGVVVPRAVVRDLHTGPEAARLMSLLMLVFSVSPILAPLSGSVLVQLTGWRGIFWAVTVAAAAGLVLVRVALPETRPAELRASSTLSGAARGYFTLLGDRYFLGVTLIGAFAISAFFVYLANSSFVLIERYGLSPHQYSLAFSVNAVSFIGVAQLTGRLSQRLGLARVVGIGAVGCALLTTALALIVSTGADSLYLIGGMLFVAFGFLGLVIPTTAVLALEEHGTLAGTASALMGTLQMVTGAIAIATVGRFLDGSVLPMLIGIAACAIIALGLSAMTLGGRRRRSAG